MTFPQALEMIAQVLKCAREPGLADILVNTSEMAGFEPSDARWSARMRASGY